MKREEEKVYLEKKVGVIECKKTSGFGAFIDAMELIANRNDCQEIVEFENGEKKIYFKTKPTENNSFISDLEGDFEAYDKMIVCNTSTLPEAHDVRCLILSRVEAVKIVESYDPEIGNILKQKFDRLVARIDAEIECLNSKLRVNDLQLKNELSMNYLDMTDESFLLMMNGGVSTSSQKGIWKAEKRDWYKFFEYIQGRNPDFKMCRLNECISHRDGEMLKHNNKTPKKSPIDDILNRYR